MTELKSKYHISKKYWTTGTPVRYSQDDLWMNSSCAAKGNKWGEAWSDFYCLWIVDNLSISEYVQTSS